MSAPRLTFLYPHLFRRPLGATGQASRNLRAACQRSHQQVQRYSVQPEVLPASQDQAYPSPHNREGQSQSSSGDQEGHRAENKRDGDGDQDGNTIDVTVGGTQPKTTNGQNSRPAEPTPELSLQLSTTPLGKVLHMEPPTSRAEDGGSRSYPPGPMHHFDTYSAVQTLQESGFTREQSITATKAVRGLLTENMRLARQDLVSKSMSENAGYLFRAASSELKTEVENGRRSAAEKMRSERRHIQHEVDILGQRVGQETATLKEELRGIFDDRKMAIRMEQRGMESTIQELNYKIQSVLGGQTKGEVESLRWHLTSRAAIFIGGLAVAVVVAIQYSVYVREGVKKAKAAESSQPSEEDLNKRHTHPTHSTAGTQTSDSTDTLLSSMDAKTSQNYVSLG